MNRKYFLFFLLFVMGVLTTLQAQNQADSIRKTDTVLDLHTIGTAFHLNRMEIRNMPFFQLSEFGMPRRLTA